jgi:hypothetical protein
MKKNIKYLVLSIVAFGLFSVSPATAGECSEADPCGTWAVVSESGTVINIIVCQPSVCGSGTFNNQKVVLQVPASPVTHNSQGGWLTSPSADPATGSTAVTYDQNKNEFTLNNQTQTVKVEVINSNENTDQESVDVLSTKVSTNKSTFSPTDLTNGVPVMKPVIDSNSSATISVTSTVVNSETTSTEEYTFVTPQTSSQIDEVITEEDYPLLNTYIGRIKVMLGFFVI